MRRGRSVIAAATILLALACIDQSITGPGSTEARSDISDAVHNNGRTHFYFLPPMVSAPSTSGTFDATLSPVVDICPSNGATCTDSAIATFSTTSGTGSELVRVSTTDQQYIVNWHTDAFNLPAGSIYRVRIRIAGRVIGYADVAVIANAGQAKNVATGQYIALVDGKTLPIKFRIELGMPVSVTVAPNPATVIVGKTTTLVATVKDAHDQTLPDQPVAWTTSASEIATVSATGTVTGVALGSTTVSASSESITASSQVNVVPAPVDKIEVTPASKTLFVGKHFQLAASLKDADGNVLSGRSVNWTSTDNSVVSVDGTGALVAMAIGAADITAISEGKAASSHIIVIVPPVATVSISPNPVSLTLGNTAQLAATIKDGDGNVLSGRTVIWASASPGLTVNSDGLVTAVAAGTYVLTATSEGVTGSATIIAADPVNLGALPGSNVSEALAVNDVGDVVGWSTTPVGYHRAVLWKGGSIVDLGTLPGGTQSEAYGISADGKIIGYSDGPGFPSHAVSWSSTSPYTITDIGTFPTGTTSVARGISSSGIIVGSGFTQIPDYPVGNHAFKYSGNALEDLGILMPEIGPQTTMAHGVSDNGTVIGTALVYWTNEPWGWVQHAGDPAMYRPKGIDSGNSSIALSINSTGKMAGYSRMACPETSQPFLCDLAVYWSTSDGQGFPLVDYSLIRSSRATGINSLGDAVGYAKVNGVTHGLFWANGNPGGTQIDPVAGSSATFPQAINSSRLIVGYVQLPAGVRAFRYQVP
jgi:probable HAF family extracellular repeat protein